MIDRNIFRVLALSFAAFMTVSCAKDTVPAQEQELHEVTLTASLAGDTTRSVIDALDRTKVNWSEGDQIAVWAYPTDEFENNDYSHPHQYVLTLCAGQGTPNGSFAGQVQGTLVCAVYPASCSLDLVDNIDILSVLPTVQTVPAGSFDPNAALMAGRINDGTISFYHSPTYCKIVAPEDVTGLESITLMSADRLFVTGNSYIDSYDATLGLDESLLSVDHVTIKPDGGTFVPGAVYYAAVRSNYYTNGLLKICKYVDNVSHTAQTRTVYPNGEFFTNSGAARYPSFMSEDDQLIYDAVQLWPDGPFFCTVNLAAVSDYTTASGNGTNWFSAPYNDEWCGEHYTWGGYYDLTDDHNEGNADLSGRDDSANRSYGCAWRMMTENDVIQLMDGLSTGSGTGTTLGLVWEWIDGTDSKYCEGCDLRGYKISGKAGTSYENNSIFLPATGTYFDDAFTAGSVSNSLDYWTSTCKDGHPVSLHATVDGQTTATADRATSMCVRAVLAD